MFPPVAPGRVTIRAGRCGRCPHGLHDSRRTAGRFERLRRLPDREVRPLEEQLNQEFWSYSPDLAVITEAASTVQRRSAEQGFYAAHMPEEVGGQG